MHCGSSTPLSPAAPYILLEQGARGGWHRSWLSACCGLIHATSMSRRAHGVASTPYHCLSQAKGVDQSTESATSCHLRDSTIATPVPPNTRMKGVAQHSGRPDALRDLMHVVILKNGHVQLLVINSQDFPVATSIFGVPNLRCFTGVLCIQL